MLYFYVQNGVETTRTRKGMKRDGRTNLHFQAEKNTRFLPYLPLLYPLGWRESTEEQRWRKKEETMKRYIFLTVIMFTAVCLYVANGYAETSPPNAAGEESYGYYGPGPGGVYCPYCGQYTCPGYGMGPRMGRVGPGMMGRGYGSGPGMGPGMMGRGYGMGPGMMGRGYGMGPGMRGGGWGYYGPRQEPPPYQMPRQPLTREDASQQVQEYLNATGNPNIMLGEVQEKETDFEATIVTKDGSLVDRILVDKNSGWMRPAS
jgi:hypothetical protein